MKTESKPEPVLWLTDARGAYIPRDFATSFADRSKNVIGVSEEDWQILEAGPDHELYCDTWCNLCDRAIVTDDNGARYMVYQNGDCWLVPVGMAWSDEECVFTWGEVEEEESSQ